MSFTTVNMTGNPDIDGILSGVRWAGNLMSYGFPTSGGAYGDYARDVDVDGNPDTPPVRVDETNGFSALNNDQQAAADRAFIDFSRFTLMTAFEAEPADNADVRLAMSSTRSPGNTTAYGGYPGDGTTSGDIWLNPSDYNTPRLGSYAYQTFFHEIGHTLGLKHGHEASNGNATTLPNDHDSLEFSTMTYKSYVGSPVGAYSVADGNFPQTYMMLDIAALQTMYGTDYGIYGGNTAYRFDPETGQTFIDGVGQGVPLLATGEGSNVLFRTIWDGNGIDSYDFSAYTSGLDLDLAPGGWTDVDSSSNLQAANLDTQSGTPHYARGEVFNAMLMNGDTRSLIENAIGGIGNDHMRGNQADNWLRGGDGNDVLEGFDGNDILDQGDAYADGLFDPGAMYGGNGNDTMWASAGAETIDGGSGADLVNYSRSTARVVIDTTAGKVTEGFAAGDTLIGVEQIAGTGYDDYIVMGDGDNYITGYDGNDSLAGGAGNDSLYGGNGNDELRGGTGADVIDGAAGTDTASFEQAVVINLGTGVHGGEATGDRFSSIEQYRGGAEADIMIASNSQAARFIGGNGADTLIGGDKDDWLQGGQGADTLVGGSGFDMVSYADAPGRIVADLSDVDANSQGTIFAGDWGFDALTSIEDVEGTAFNDTLYGDAGSNKLVGLDGADFIDGRQGADYLLGGAGNDTVKAGDSDFDYGGDGVDAITFDAAAYVDVTAQDFRVGGLGFYMTEFEKYVGSGSADFFSGASYGETFDGGAGNDVIHGQGGDDFLVVGAGGDVMDGGSGHDTMVFSRSMVADWQSGVLDADIASDSWTAWEAIQGASGDDRIRTNSWGYDVELRGGAGNDVLGAGNGNDSLVGEDGDDTLTGGDGNDTVLGGAGNDTLLDFADRLNGDSFSDFAIGDLIDVSGLRFGALRYDQGTGLLELDTQADGGFATQLQLAADLHGEFVAIASDDALPASTAVRLMLDSDGDGVADFHDNSILVANPDQRDSDGDGYGNVSDPDLNQDLVIDLFDLSLLDERFNSADPDADFNGDGAVDLYDLSVMDAMFGGAPGPSYVDGAIPVPVAGPAEALAELMSSNSPSDAEMPHGHFHHPNFKMFDIHPVYGI